MFINRNMYSCGRCMIPCDISHDFVGVAQAIILTIIFCMVNTITLLGEVPINISAHQYGLPETQL